MQNSVVIIQRLNMMHEVLLVVRALQTYLHRPLFPTKKIRNAGLTIKLVNRRNLHLSNDKVVSSRKIGNKKCEGLTARRKRRAWFPMALFSQPAYKTNRQIIMKTRNSKNSEGPTLKEELSSKLGQLFEDELRDIYWAEKALTKAIPKMIKNATSEELAECLEHHLQETEEHVARVEQIFSMLGKEPKGKKCEGMEGIIKEAQGLMKESDKGVMRDAAIISAAQKAEHYEISSYGTLRTFAQTIGLREAVPVLESTLEEEKNADRILTEVATSTV